MELFNRFENRAQIKGFLKGTLSKKEGLFDSLKNRSLFLEKK